MTQAPHQTQIETPETGSYFVSNYPPYRYWSAEKATPLPRSLQEHPSPEVPLGIYVHIPFCRQRCHFCYFKVYEGKNAREVDLYMSALLREIDLLTQQPAISGRKPLFLYFGGGTPSYISRDQFDRFMEGFNESISLADIQEFTLECEPGTISLEKLNAFKSAGVSRASLGIEHFDDEILSANGRAHNRKAIYEAFEYMRKAQIPQVNIDLIAGMPGDRESSWLDTVQRTLDLQPDSVTIYQLEFPYNTTFSKELRAQGELSVPTVDWPTKRSWTQMAFEQLENSGYQLTSGYTASRKASKNSFVYRDALWRGADMLGVGVSAFSHIGGTNFQNEKHMQRYLEILENDQLPIQRGYALDETERLIRELVLQLKKGHLEPSYFQTKFGLDISKVFEVPLSRLESMGLLSRQKDRLCLTREALLQVDQLLPDFFLAKHRNTRR